jgi:hypothetical protein
LVSENGFVSTTDRPGVPETKMTDFTNDASLRAAILANIRKTDELVTIGGVLCPNLSCPENIANRIESHEGRHPHLRAVKRCLEQLLNEHLIMAIHTTREGRVVASMYGPNPANAAEDAIWQNFNERVRANAHAREAARVAAAAVEPSDPNEPADPSY